MLIKLSIYELTHLNIYLLVAVTEDDETVELLLCRANSSGSSTAKTFLELTRQNDKPKNFSKVSSLLCQTPLSTPLLKLPPARKSIQIVIKVIVFDQINTTQKLRLTAENFTNKAKAIGQICSSKICY